ncbi:hypothetical protein Neosp_007925 [[Neocosmospora] mangrovei]
MSDASSDSDDSHKPRQNTNHSKAIARHIAVHLQVLMFLTLHFAGLQNDEGVLDDDINSDSADVDEGNSASEGNDLGRLSDIASNSDIIMNEVDDTDNTDNTLDLDDGVLKDDIPVPDTDFDLGGIPRQYEGLRIENDVFLKEVLESGAYQSWKYEREETTPELLWNYVYDALKDDPQAVELLGAKEKHDGLTPLLWAARHGYENVAQLVLEKGADPEAKDGNSYQTPLEIASHYGHVAVVELLLNKGADITVADTFGSTPLATASRYGDEAIVKLLLDKGADVTVRDSSGWTPLAIASRYGHKAIVKLLLGKGADATVTTDDGWTPLLAASKGEHDAVVELLLENGAHYPEVSQPMRPDSRTPDAFHNLSQLDSTSVNVERNVEELSDEEHRRLVQRLNAIKNLIDTEAVFVREMNIVEEIYKGTAEACPKLDGRTMMLIFRNSEEVVGFHTSFLAQLRNAVASVYVQKLRRPWQTESSSFAHDTFRAPSDAEDRATSLGSVFRANMEKMKLTHEVFLRDGDQAAKSLIQLQQDPTVQMWLNECNEVVADLTHAWNLDALLIKVVQRITNYPNLIGNILQYTPQDHPDRASLVAAKNAMELAIVEIGKTKRNFEFVSQVVGRKRKESDARTGFVHAISKRIERLPTFNNRLDVPEDVEYTKLDESFRDNYLQIQVVLRDIEFYMRQVSAYVNELAQYASSIELVARIEPRRYPRVESKWVQFSIEIRDLQMISLEEHLDQIRKRVIEPFQHLIRAYGNPSLAMKKRQKRRLEYERSEQLKLKGKPVDGKLQEVVDQYEALDAAIKKELPILFSLTNRVGNICLENMVNIQVNWYSHWKEKMEVVLGDCSEMPNLDDVVSTFQRNYLHAEKKLMDLDLDILKPGDLGDLGQIGDKRDDPPHT